MAVSFKMMMDTLRSQDTTDAFETWRPLLFSIAYRMLGSAMEAEDMVQETYLRYRTVDATEIQNPKAFLCTVVTRLCLNQLESARVQREAYYGPWLPEPLATASGIGMVGGGEAPSPEKEAELYESISVAFLVLLEQLSPVERAVWLLREVFEFEYDEIAEIVQKEQAACRQIFARAKKHLAEQRPRFSSSPEEHKQLLTQFLSAIGAGDMNDLTALLANDALLVTDGGGKARGAATQRVHGNLAVAQFLMNSTRLVGEGATVSVAEINGQPSAVVRTDGQVRVVIALEVGDGIVQQVRVMGNPDKLRWV